MLIVVLAAFVLCWTPFQIYTLYGVYRDKKVGEVVRSTCKGLFKAYM